METQVAIIGAGPAGASLSYFLAKQGLEVTLIDKESFPRDKPCGDGIGPRSVYILQQMGLTPWLKNFFRVEKVRLISPQGEAISAKIPAGSFPVDYGYIIPRKKFDHQLLKTAQEAGANFIPNFKVQSLLFEEGKVSGARGVKKGKALTIKAKLVVVAVGSGSLLKEKPPPSFGALASRTYFTGIQGIDAAINIYFDKNLPKGYGWIFPLSRNSANVGIGLFTSSKEKLQLKEVFKKFVNSRYHTPLSLEKAKEKSSLKGGRLLMDFGGRNLTYPGMALVGEAAGLVSPINGEGIAFALESSRLLAECLEGKLKNSGSIEKALEIYRKKMENRYLSYFRLSRTLNTLFARPFLLERIIKKAGGDQDLAQVLAGLFSNTLPPEALLKARFLKFLL